MATWDQFVAERPPPVLFGPPDPPGLPPSGMVPGMAPPLPMTPMAPPMMPMAPPMMAPPEMPAVPKVPNVPNAPPPPAPPTDPGYGPAPDFGGMPTLPGAGGPRTLFTPMPPPMPGAAPGDPGLGGILPGMDQGLGMPPPPDPAGEQAIQREQAMAAYFPRTLEALNRTGLWKGGSDSGFRPDGLGRRPAMSADPGGMPNMPGMGADPARQLQADQMRRAEQAQRQAAQHRQQEQAMRQLEQQQRQQQRMRAMPQRR